MAKEPDGSYRVDEADPFAGFVRRRLGWEWWEMWMATFLLYGPIEKLLIPKIGGYLEFYGGFRNWVPDIEALLTGFLWFPAFFAYYLWSGRGIGRLFENLGDSGVFVEGQRYHEFWERARVSLNRPLWIAIGGALALFVMLLFQFVIWGKNTPLEPWFESRWPNPFHRALAILMIGVVGYVVFQTLIREILALLWLRRLWREQGRDAVIQPYHVDDAGGLGAIGHHALHLSTFLVLLLLFIVMGSLLPSLRAGGESTLSTPVWYPGVRSADKIAFDLWTPWLGVAWTVYLIVPALSVGLLFWLPHRRMREVRDSRLGLFSRRLDDLLKQQDRALEGEGGDLESIIKEIKQTRDAWSQTIQDFPLWPVSRELRVRLGVSSAFPAVSIAATEALAFLVKAL